MFFVDLVIYVASSEDDLRLENYIVVFVRSIFMLLLVTLN